MESSEEEIAGLEGVNDEEYDQQESGISVFDDIESLHKVQLNLNLQSQMKLDSQIN